MKIKQLKKMPILKGDIPLIAHHTVIALIGNISNNQSKAIDYLYEVICEQNKEIEKLKEVIVVGGIGLK